MKIICENGYNCWYWRSDLFYLCFLALDRDIFRYRFRVMKQSLSFLFWHAFRGPDVASLRVKTLFQAM